MFTFTSCVITPPLLLVLFTFLTCRDWSNLINLYPPFWAKLLLINILVAPLFNNAFTVLSLWVSIFSIPTVIYTFFRGLNIHFTSLASTFCTTFWLTVSVNPFRSVIPALPFWALGTVRSISLSTMAFSFLSYMADRKSSLSLLLHLSCYMHYTLLFLLFFLAPPFLSTPLPPCNFHTIYVTVVFYLGTLIYGFPESWCPYSHIHNISQRSPFLSALSILPCSSWLLLGVVILCQSATSLSSRPPLKMLLSLFYSSHSFWDTSAFCAPLLHIQNTLPSLSLLFVFSPPLLHIALLDFSMLRIYCLLLSSSFAPFHSCSSRQGA